MKRRKRATRARRATRRPRAGEPVQRELFTRKGGPRGRRGGFRRRAGRKPVHGARQGPVHRARPLLAGRHPVMVTMRMGPQIRKNVRAPRYFRRIRKVLWRAKFRFGCRICHFSVQRDHIHLICEPPAGARGTGIERELSRAMKGLAVRVARALNKALGRKGQVFPHRYDARVLRSPLEVKRALVYVINNAKKHSRRDGIDRPRGWIDPCSSAEYVCVVGGRDEMRSGWNRRGTWALGPRPPDAADPVIAPRTWLLGRGWHEKHGALDLSDAPATR